MRLKASQLILTCLMLVITDISVCVARTGPAVGDVYNIRYTVHNLSNNEDRDSGLTKGERNYAAYKLASPASGGANQVCIFCHTPHNAATAVPLWNKTLGVASSYRLYTSSRTLSSEVRQNSSITVDSPSLLCLSCHDGKTAINVQHNSNYRDADASSGDAIIAFSSTPDARRTLGSLWQSSYSFNPSNLGAVRDSTGRIATLVDATNGTNLADDHPIGFSYANAIIGKSFKSSPDDGIRLFKGRVECTSCHDPHVFYGSSLAGGSRVDLASKGLNVSYAQRARAPFLSVSNVGSGLCLGCHIK